MGDGVRHAVAKVPHDAHRASEQKILDHHVHGGHVERLEHDLRHVLSVGLEVQVSCCAPKWQTNRTLMS